MEKSRLLKAVEEATARVASWPQWKKDVANGWSTQLRLNNEIDQNNLKGWGPFDQ